MVRKGISPLIASVLLIAFTMSIAMIAGPFFSDLMQQTQSSQEDEVERVKGSLDSGFEFKSATYDKNLDKLDLTIQNSGTDSLENFSVKVYGDTLVQKTYNTSLGPKEAKSITINSSSKPEKIKISAINQPTAREVDLTDENLDVVSGDIVIFPNGDFEECTLEGWNYDWFEAVNQTTCLAQSNNTGEHNTVAYIEKTIDLSKPKEISFAWYVSSESSYDFGRFLVDGSKIYEKSGDLGWMQESLQLSEGKHTVRWEYEKDGSVSSNDDLIKVDNVTAEKVLFASFVYDPSYPDVGQSVSFDASESATFGSATYNWLFGDGTNGSGKTTSHSYSSEGFYEVNLTLKENGSSDSAVDFIGVNKSPENLLNGDFESCNEGGWNTDDFSVIDTSDDTCVARSENVGEHSTTAMIGQSANLGSLSGWEFWNLSVAINASSEEGYDKGKLIVDNGVKASVSGKTGWVHKSAPIWEGGSHTFNITYSKDSCCSSNADRVWADNLSVKKENWTRLRGVNGSWDSYGLDKRNTGYKKQDVGPDKGQEIWTVSKEEDGFYSPVLANNTLYLSKPGAKLISVNASTGQTIWEYDPGDSTYGSSPALKEGKVYFGAGSGFYSIDADTGQMNWNYSLGSEGTAVFHPTIDGKYIFVGEGGLDPGLHAVNQTTGGRIWHTDFGSGANGAPAVYNGKVFLGTDGSKVYAFDKQNGSILWNFSTDGLVQSGITISEGILYVGERGGELWALNTTDGSIVWNHSAGGDNGIALAHGRVYTADPNGNFYALNKSNGNQVWNVSISAQEPVVVNDTIYTADANGNILAVNSSTGGKIWSYSTNLDLSWPMSPAVADNVLYIAADSFSNKILAVGERE